MAEKTKQTIAIIVAGGSGKRFGADIPKQFVPLAEHPLLLRTIRVFQDSKLVDGICVVVPPEHHETVERWVRAIKLDKLQWIVAGGQERQDSTQQGFAAIPPCEYVLVHDGARPLVTVDLIERVLRAAYEKGAAVPGLSLTETLKKVAEGGHVLATVDRNEYTTVQTPQAFRYTLLAEALQEAKQDQFYGTDEAMLIERMGFPVCVVSGASDNIKVTEADDLQLAELFLKRREA